MSLKDLNRLLKESEEIKSGNFSSILGKQFEFDTQEEADEYFYKEVGQCDSDDVDREQSKIDSWIADNNIIIKENE